MSSTMIYVIFMTLCHGELPRICYSSPGEMYLTQDKCDGELDRRWHDYNDIGGDHSSDAKLGQHLMGHHASALIPSRQTTMATSNNRTYGYTFPCQCTHSPRLYSFACGSFPAECGAEIWRPCRGLLAWRPEEFLPACFRRWNSYKTHLARLNQYVFHGAPLDGGLCGQSPLRAVVISRSKSVSTLPAKCGGDPVAISTSSNHCSITGTPLLLTPR
jgi:hypothetical protein